jgi:hypothetical protein
MHYADVSILSPDNAALPQPGSTLLRKYRNGTDATHYPVPTMMMSGTLDGLFRVTRQAESFYHYCSTDPVCGFSFLLSARTRHLAFPLRLFVFFPGFGYLTIRSD